MKGEKRGEEEEKALSSKGRQERGSSIGRESHNRDEFHSVTEGGRKMKRKEIIKEMARGSSCERDCLCLERKDRSQTTTEREIYSKVEKDLRKRRKTLLELLGRSGRGNPKGDACITQDGWKIS